MIMNAKTRNSQTNKSNHMNDKAFADLKAAFEGVLAFEQARTRDLLLSRIRAIAKKHPEVLLEEL